MIDEEIKKLNDEFKRKSDELFERYKAHPLRDGYTKEDDELRHWYEAELRTIYERFSKTA